MVSPVKPLSRMFAAVLAILALLVAPVTARAQALPSYGRPTPISQEQTISGRITSVDSTFHLTVQDDRGFLDSVQLHQGTIINPTGLTLAPGMSVTIIGFPSGSSFDANQIDTPYTYSGPAPTPVYYGAGWWYPGFAYGYGPAFSLSLAFGYGGYHYARTPFYGHAFFGFPGVAVGVGFYGAPYYRGGYYGAPYYHGGYYHGGYYGAPYYHGGYYGGSYYHGGYYGGPAYRGAYHGTPYRAAYSAPASRAGAAVYRGGAGYRGGGGGGRGHR